MTLDKVETIEINGWIIKQRFPLEGKPNFVIVMLHGWTGDENAMWIFASRMPDNAWIISPRGLWETKFGGFGWHKPITDRWPKIEEFKPAVISLQNLLQNDNLLGSDFEQINFVGFSQGAALAFSYAFIHPKQVNTIVGLSGFIPEGGEAFVLQQPLLGKDIFLAHGTLDELVPVERARQAVQILQKAGASVTYCEDNVGHKLSASCFRGMESFLSNRFSGPRSS